MRITQGTFSYLPDFTPEEVAAQVTYCLRNGWAVSIEFTDDPHPRNTYWEMWGMPLFDLTDPDKVMDEINACVQAQPNSYVKLNGFDSSKGRQSTMLSFLVNRPAHEQGFELERTEVDDRRIRYTLRRKPALTQQQSSGA